MVNPDDISGMAEREKEKEKKRGQQKPKQTIPHSFAPRSCESWYVFSRIYPHYPNFFWWVFVVLTLGIVFLAICFSTGISRPVGQWSFYTGMGFIGLFILRLLVHHIMKITAFGRYKDWRQKTGFTINGWEKLGMREDFPKIHHWDKLVEYTVNVEGFTTEAVRKTIHDALYLFMVRANNCFYEKNFIQTGYSGEIRTKWNFSGELSVAGSANEMVMGHMYLNVVNYLKPIHEKHRVIKAVDIKYSGEIRQVEPPSTD
ncbi:MAG TPA: hypothetical protein VD905_11830 [Flavobacteriales bacterium]|nr:hypothetical protein [Flavobacteriales bacterium]